MKKLANVITGIGVTAILLTTVLVTADDDDKYERGEHGKGGYLSKMFSKKPDVAPVKDSLYREECGSCHFAYQAGLLPARSWKKMMGNLENHFDENAELDKETQAKITTYLLKNAADDANYKRSIRIMNSLRKSDTPLRITQTPYFIRKHDEIPSRMVKGNPKVGSFSKCAACHTSAEKGLYDDNVRIPGVGKWDD